MSGLDQGALLPLPCPSAEREAVDQDDRTPGAVVFVIDVDGSRVLFPYRDGWHIRNLRRFGAWSLLTHPAAATGKLSISRRRRRSHHASRVGTGQR